ncbi:hypothetical protein [Hyphobacterium sp.]|uniref:hypothetical protein n=1 Tax=Hyphobacterium sp. TaxID=2004662 RepID=UPI0037478A75
MGNSTKIIGSKLMVVISMVGALGALSACDVSPRANASWDCKTEIRDRMRNPSDVQIHYLEGEEVSTNTFLNRYRVRGENAFGAQTEEIWMCRWEQTYQGDGGWSDYRYRIRVWRTSR